jgi:DNA-binding beta-propeller fold protein YncE
VLAALGATWLGCEKTTVAPGNDCDELNPGSFSITSPEVGRVYVWCGTGVAGLGEMGRAPGSTELYWPVEINFAPNGEPIVLDWNNHRVLALDADGKFEKIIGKMFGEPEDTLAVEAKLNHPTHVTFSPDGTKLYLSAWHNSVVLEMDRATGWIRRYAGTGGRCYNGDGQNRLATALDLPVCALFHPITGELYVSDQGNQIVRKIDAAGVVHTVAGTVPGAYGCGGAIYRFGFSGDGGPATSALLNLGRGQLVEPSARFCFDAAGNLYIADTNNHAVRIVYFSDGTIDTYAGKPALGPGHSGDGGPATEAQLQLPRDVAVDTDGSLFIADSGNHVVRKVAPDGTISTVVGVVRPRPSSAITACALHEEQGARARSVTLTKPVGVELDPRGNLCIADTENNVIRVLYR